MIKYNISKDPDIAGKEEFYKQARESVEDNDIDDACFEELFYNKPSFEFLMHFLPHYPYEIIKPISISIEIGRDSGCYVVWCEGFNKFGMGSTKDEAIEDFENNVVTDYLILEESNLRELSKDAKELLKLYKSYIKLQ